MIEKVRDGLWIDRKNGDEYGCSVVSIDEIPGDFTKNVFIYKIPFVSKLSRTIAVLKCDGLSNGYDKFDEFMNSLEG